MRRATQAGLAAFACCAWAPSATAADLALSKVLLSSAGVGYFEYAADVDGPATLGLDVRLDQVDDVLKSLVVLDTAGSVGGVELAGRDQTHAAFGDVPFGPEALNAPLDYLNSLQGVEIDVQGPRPMSGRLLHADTVTEPAAPDRDGTARSIERTRVSVLTGDGLRQFVLEDADSVQVADPNLRGRVSRALAALRHDGNADARHLTIRVSGTSRRTVRVGFVAVAPLWKASYRLLLPPEAGGDARLQGWATLENASVTDWSGVELTLQYGNPVTFHQAIYRSYFVSRPEVPVDVLGRLLPDVDTVARPEPPPPAEAPAGSASKSFRALASGAPPAPPAPAPAIAAPEQAVAATEASEETVFRIPTPVTLAAGHSASVPLLDVTLPVERIDLAQPDAVSPLAAVRVRNPGQTSMPAGVLTLYDPSGAAQYAGDARLGGLPAGETRLLSFAQDLRTHLEWHRDSAVTIAALTAAGGVLHLDERERQTTRVVITGAATPARTVLVAIPKRADQTLPPDGPRPSEETASAWRFAVAMQPGETKTLNVAVDRLRRQSSALIGDTATLARVLNEQGLSEAARAALGHLAELRAQEAARAGERQQFIAQLEAAGRDEARLRDNIAALGQSDALRTRLVRQLDADESRIAQLQQSSEQATQAVERAHRALIDAIDGLRL